MNIFKTYLEGKNLTVNELTPDIKRKILKDYEKWSSGFAPNEMAPEDHKKYIKFALSSKYQNLSEQIEEWLYEFEGPKETSTKRSILNTKVIENEIKSQELRLTINSVFAKQKDLFVTEIKLWLLNEPLEKSSIEIIKYFKSKFPEIKSINVKDFKMLSTKKIEIKENWNSSAKSFEAITSTVKKLKLF